MERYNSFLPCWYCFSIFVSIQYTVSWRYIVWSSDFLCLSIFVWLNNNEANLGETHYHHHMDNLFLMCFKNLYSEKALAPHSSTLAWRIPGTAEPGGLPSMGSHKVGHDWSDLAAAVAAWGQDINLWETNRSKMEDVNFHYTLMDRESQYILI